MMSKFLLLLILSASMTLSSALLAQNDEQLTKAVEEMKRIYNETYQAEAGIAAAQKVINLADKNTAEYFEGIFHKTDWLIYQKNKQEIQPYLDTMDLALKSCENPKLVRKYRLYSDYLNANYNYSITQNREKGLIQCMHALDNGQFYPFILKKLTLIAAKVFADLGQYSIGNTFVKTHNATEIFNAKSKLEKAKHSIEVSKTLTELEEYEKAEKLLQKVYNDLLPIKDEASDLFDECRFQMAFNDSDNHERVKTLIGELLSEGKRKYKYLGLLGNSYSFNNDYEKALPLIQEALSMMVEDFHPKDIYDNPLPDADMNLDAIGLELLYFKTWALRLKAEELYAAGKQDEALEVFYKAIEAGEFGIFAINMYVDKMVGYELALLVSNNLIHVQIGGIIHAATKMCELFPSDAHFDMLFEYMEKRKSLTIHQALAPSPIPDDLDAKFQSYAAEIQKLEVEFSKLRLNFLVDAWSHIPQHINDLEDFAQTELFPLPKIRLHQKDFDYLKATDIQAQLDDSTIFIQYSPIRDHYYVILITKERMETRLLLKSNIFHKEIRAYTKMISSPLLVQEKRRDKFIDASQKLYDTLLRPFEKDLAGKNHIIISPERHIFYLPFETLLRSDEKKPFHELDFLIKNYKISYQYSSTLHQKLQKRPAVQDFSMLAFAPVFSDGKATNSKDRSVRMFKKDAYKTLKKREFVHLPNTKKEVENIQNMLQGKGHVKVLLEKDATKANLQQALSEKSYQFVHIATHSMAHYNDPRLSAIACYQEEGDDNLYFAYEIEKMPIQADLVILSSCESGLGRLLHGEGILGLNKSFIISGARNVIFSLWKVSDEYSSELMIKFYQSYLKNVSYSSALYEAKLQMLEDPITANPRFWASFVLIGE